MLEQIAQLLVNGLVAGTLFAAALLIGALVQPWLGRVSDRLGRRRVLVGIALAGAVVAAAIAVAPAGATLMAITPEQAEYSRKITRTQKLGFDILWDGHNDYAGRMGLKFSLPQDLKQLYQENFNINLRLYHGDDDWTLLLPARFVIDRTGVIRYSEACPDYRRRPDPDEVLEILEGLG